MTVPDDLRGVHIDTTLPDGFGSVDLRLTGVTPLVIDPITCRATGKVIAREVSRRGTWNGSFTYANCHGLSPSAGTFISGASMIRSGGFPLG